MTQHQRIYPVTTFPGGEVNFETLYRELSDAPDVTTQLTNLTTGPLFDSDGAVVSNPTDVGGNVIAGGGAVTLTYAAQLGVSEINALDGGITADGSQTDPLIPTSVLGNHNSAPTKVEQSTTSAGVVRTQNQPQTPGLRYCDRDVKLTTGKVTTADATEDMKVDLVTNKLVSWNEVSLLGCFKKDGAGDYVPCSDQVDADANAELSVWEFVPNDQGDPAKPCMIEVLGGTMTPDSSLPAGWDHLVFVIGAPNVPKQYGGEQRMFDGYLQAYAVNKGTIQAIAPAAQPLDPSVNPEGGKMKIWIYYPAGTSHTHLMRLVTYRAPETM